MYRNSKLPKLYSFIYIKKFQSKTIVFRIRINQPNNSESVLIRIHNTALRNFKFNEF